MSIAYAILISVISLFATICTIVTFVINRATTVKKAGSEDGQQLSDIKYIKRRIDEVLLEQREVNKTIDIHAERLTRVEESVKNAHNRIEEYLAYSKTDRETL